MSTEEAGLTDAKSGEATGEAEEAAVQPFVLPGHAVLTTLGTGVVLEHRPDDIHVIRLWAPRGLGAATAFLGRSALIRPVKAAVGFEVTTPMGRGTVTEFRPGAGAEAEAQKKTEGGAEAEAKAEASEVEASEAEGEGGSGEGEDAFVVALSWQLADGNAARGFFKESDVVCVGGAVLPVIERLTTTATRFLQWTGSQMSTMVGDGDTIADKFNGLKNAGTDLMKRLETEAGQQEGGMGGALSAISKRFNDTRESAKVLTAWDTLPLLSYTIPHLPPSPSLSLSLPLFHLPLSLLPLSLLSLILPVCQYATPLA